MSKKIKSSEKSNKPGQTKNPKSLPAKAGSSKFLWLGSILLLTIIAFFPSFHCDFTAWDDHLYVTESELVKSLSFENIKRIFSSEGVVALNYHPLSIISLAIDYHFSKLDPVQYHFVNIFFHLLNTSLVFLFTYRLSGRKIFTAFFVALFFAIHPMHVESVTWISERKDVLYSFFFLLALHTYLTYLEKQKTGLLILTGILFLMSVLSKAMAVVLPLVLLLIDNYKGRKISLKVIAEKIPFFIVSLIFGLIAVNIQSTGAIAEYKTFSLLERIGFGFYGFIMYIIKLIFPVSLSAFYPYPNGRIGGGYPALFIILAVIGILLFLFMLIVAIIRKDKMKSLTFGSGFYFVNLIMVLQFISVGGVIMADRYSYLSYIGLLFPIGMALNEKIERNRSIKNIIFSSTIIIALIYSFLTHERTKIWNNAETLWTDVIEKYPYPPWNIEVSYEGRGKYYAVKKNDLDKALKDYETLELMKSKNPANYNNLGNIYGTKAQGMESIGDTLRSKEFYNKSVEYFSTSISLDSNVISTYTNRGLLYIYLKKFNLAAIDYNKALSLDPTSFELKEKRAYIYYLLNKREEAIQYYDTLISINPAKTQLYYLRGIARLNTGKANEAIEDFKIVTEREPNNGEAFYNLAISQLQIGDNQNASANAERAIQFGRRISNEMIRKFQEAKTKN